MNARWMTGVIGMVRWIARSPAPVAVARVLDDSGVDCMAVVQAATARMLANAIRFMVRRGVRLER